jgi:hypothetical protein
VVIVSSSSIQVSIADAEPRRRRETGKNGIDYAGNATTASLTATRSTRLQR